MTAVAIWGKMILVISFPETIVLAGPIRTRVCIICTDGTRFMMHTYVYLIIINITLCAVCCIQYTVLYPVPYYTLYCTYHTVEMRLWVL